MLMVYFETLASERLHKELLTFPTWVSRDSLRRSYDLTNNLSMFVHGVVYIFSSISSYNMFLTATWPDLGPRRSRMLLARILLDFVSLMV